MIKKKVILKLYAVLISFFLSVFESNDDAITDEPVKDDAIGLQEIDLAGMFVLLSVTSHARKTKNK